MHVAWVTRDDRLLEWPIDGRLSSKAFSILGWLTESGHTLRHLTFVVHHGDSPGKARARAQEFGCEYSNHPLHSRSRTRVLHFDLLKTTQLRWLRLWRTRSPVPNNRQTDV
jgi:hypothetical protein